ncbi:hypothetical protein FB45DRAFT_824876 [Roridomyces roridus]|uniref:Uncharacterized protein n=1 Tax=Roridomyces roridus TaxID=1738132 RepID=A0AAD7FZ00_9AGAR|nr:hypothetical protein FB45DRAFT_824876 [Roridomyces roridus]
MPVSFTVAKHPSNPQWPVFLPGSLTAEDLLAQACPDQYETASAVLGSSFSLADSTPFTRIIPNPHGLVNTIISAYNGHHNLIIRPDDVWIHIFTQFNFYLRANAEIRRANFDGKKQLIIYTEDPRDERMDFADLSRQLVHLFGKNVVDRTLRAWVLPSFSTTMLKDKTVASIVTMSTLRAYKYSKYPFQMMAYGIPHVTIEGTKSDWEDILKRLEKLKQYGIETIAWYHLLVPVIKRFVWAFDNPNGAENVEFWKTVAQYTSGGSEPGYYSGWITAFCAFDTMGQWIGPRLKKHTQTVDPPESLSASAFWDAYRYADTSEPYHGFGGNFILDGTHFHEVESLDIPSGYAHVPIKLVDRSQVEDPEWACMMVAGVVGTFVSRSTAEGGTKMDTVQPGTGWWIFRTRE